MTSSALKHVAIVKIVKRVKLILENDKNGCAFSKFKSPVCSGKF